MRAALVRESDGGVDNVILVGEDFETPEGFALYELSDIDPVSPGDIRSADGKYERPDPPDPVTSEPETPTPSDVLENDPEFNSLTQAEKRLVRVVVNALSGGTPSE